jgi:HAMP domain-containing protein
MNADQIIDAMREIAAKQYIGEPPMTRLAYHVGLLESRLREYIYQLENIQDELKQCQLDLMAKESE